MARPKELRPETWLEQVFATPLQVRLLRLLHRDVRKFWTEREAAATVGSPQPSARKVFRRLERLGLLEVRQAGRAHLVRPPLELALTSCLQDLFRKEAATLPEILKAAAAELPVGVSLYLFGSTARGTATPGSDLDLLVSGPSRESTEAAAQGVRRAVRGYAPIPTNVAALAHAELRKPRYRRLAASILRGGRLVAGPDLSEVLG